MPHKYRRGYTPQIDAEVAAQELARIWKENGQKLRPVDVVAAAEPVDAPLHPAFEWDDAQAGVAWRQQQARQLIRSVVIIRDERPPENVYVHVQLQQEEQSEHFYQAGDFLTSKPEEYFAALRDARRSLEAAADRYRALQDLAQRDGKSDDVNKIGLIMEALTTARVVAERLQ